MSKESNWIYYKRRGKLKYWRKIMSDYKKKNRKRFNEYNRLYWLKYPWMKVWQRICYRCRQQQGRYKGVSLLMTKEELKDIWFRDRAMDMIKPCVHRTKQHYSADSVIFMEYDEHSKMHLIEYNKGAGRYNPKKWRRNEV